MPRRSRTRRCKLQVVTRDEMCVLYASRVALTMHWSRSRSKNLVRRVCPGVALETAGVEDKHIGDSRVRELLRGGEWVTFSQQGTKTIATKTNIQLPRQSVRNDAATPLVE